MPFDLERFTSKLPVFTTEDLDRELASQGDTRNSKKLIESWSKNAQIVRLTRGIYATRRPLGRVIKGAWPDPFLAVAKVDPKGTIVGYGAMALHTGVPPRSVIEMRPGSDRTNGRDFDTSPTFRLTYVTRHIPGFSSVSKTIHNQAVSVCGPEAALIDCINEIRTIADCEACRAAINHPNWFDCSKVIKILELESTPKVTVARFGAFLALIQGPLGEWDALCGAISRTDRLPSEAVRWHQDMPATHLREWRITVPDEFLKWASSLHGMALPVPSNGSHPHCFAANPEFLFPLDTAEAMEPAWLSPEQSTFLDGFDPDSVLQEVLRAFPSMNGSDRSFALRPGQAEIIEAIRGGHDTLGVLPTGSGKSLIYQFLSKTLKGTTLVISPLRALMEDQMLQAEALELRAAQMHSGIALEEIKDAANRLGEWKLDLLFITPEGLKSFVWGQRHHLPKICLIVVDEAHCVSAWGFDFRRAYLDIGSYRWLFPETPILALTATASPAIQRDIVHYLDMRSPYRFLGSVIRSNLRLNATKITRSLPERLEKAKETITSSSSGQGIAYCGTTKWCDKVAYAFRAKGTRIEPYHAGLPINQRSNTQAAFMAGEIQWIAATVAFGMGINKSNVRHVIHLGFSASLEDYVQEIGRAGRDSDCSDCNLYFSYGDYCCEKNRKSTGDTRRDSIRIANAKKLYEYATTKMCRWQFLVKHFEGTDSPRSEYKCGVCDNCISKTTLVNQVSSDK